jgi:hypothetical protein
VRGRVEIKGIGFMKFIPSRPFDCLITFSYFFKNRHNWLVPCVFSVLLWMGFAIAAVTQVKAQEVGMQPGEAFSTRFSGIRETTGSSGQPLKIIDLDGIVGTIVDVRNPRGRPRGNTGSMNRNAHPYLPLKLARSSVLRWMMLRPPIFT